MSFPKNLKTLRKKRGLTQEELAEKIYVSRTLISKYESGTVFPSEENIASLSNFFQVEKSELIDLDEEKHLAKKDKDNRKINIIINSIIICVCSLFVLVSSLPIFPKRVLKEYVCTPGEGVSCYPLFNDEYHTGYYLTLSNGNPILIFAILSSLVNISLSILLLIRKANKAMRLINWILFILNVLLFLFTFMFILFYARGANMDY